MRCIVAWSRSSDRGVDGEGGPPRPSFTQRRVERFAFVFDLAAARLDAARPSALAVRFGADARLMLPRVSGFWRFTASGFAAVGFGAAGDASFGACFATAATGGTVSTGRAMGGAAGLGSGRALDVFRGGNGCLRGLPL